MVVSPARVSRRIGGAALFACASALAAQQEVVALPGHVPPALAAAQRKEAKSGADAQMLRLTVILRRHDETGFALSGRRLDPAPARFRRFLSPAADGYAAVCGWFTGNRFRVIADSANRLAIGLGATHATAAAALGIGIHDHAWTAIACSRPRPAPRSASTTRHSAARVSRPCSAR